MEATAMKLSLRKNKNFSSFSPLYKRQSQADAHLNANGNGVKFLHKDFLKLW